MIEMITGNAGNIMALMCLPLAFVVIWAKDLILLKFELLKGKKRGAKFVIGISTDRTIRIGAKTPEDNNKFVFKNDSGVVEEIPINSKRLYFSPQFGVQAAMVTQGAKTLFDPYSDSTIDPIDGEYIAVAISKAKALRDYGQGWLDTKEQKILVLILIVCIGVGLLQFAGMSQVAELTEAIKPIAVNMAKAVVIPGEVPL